MIFSLEHWINNNVTIQRRSRGGGGGVEKNVPPLSRSKIQNILLGIPPLKPTIHVFEQAYSKPTFLAHTAHVPMYIIPSAYLSKALYKMI